ncbi:PREDICTED: N-fatty-acyl-amino acid synthase/hydrolase PM20D1-like [Branchiostoma belcheri]|uniref:N-fatty-acyl-amino acid synthase/hydrolase PM20D1-like n=1 Tax=Branchiostoma belcheri TaxID=7741 RepID=A0A6P4XPZ8_BRABE|nr:PREDICTED: N-fatty-acyl-amino acid synthase/hydrolase PM20D1-like [Branchiostoma belcheri]
MSTAQSLLQWVGAALLCVAVIVVVRTATFPSYQTRPPPCNATDQDFIPATRARLDRLSQAVTFRTVSYEPGRGTPEELRKFLAFLRASFPALHASPLVTREVVGNFSLLYRVQGSDRSLKPALLAAHLDVVPVTEEPGWEAEPFSGQQKDGFVYGRGTIDCKHNVLGQLEALEFHLNRGHRPRRALYLAYGHDEEVSGHYGARKIGELLEERGVKPEFILDEGLTVTKGVVPGVGKKVAMVAITEKGYVTVKLSVRVKGGHGSMPEKESAIGILSQAVTNLERNLQPNLWGSGPERDFAEHLATEMSLLPRLLTANLWLFTPVVRWVLAQKPSTNALCRTTTAVTRFNAGIKDNVIAPEAVAIVNHRVHPKQTIQEVLEHNLKVIDDPRVKMEVVESLVPAPVSPSGPESAAYMAIQESIQQIYPDSLVAPSVLMGNTDTRHYWNLTSAIYRFSPNVMTPEDLTRFHGVNERISVQDYERVMNFYFHLMRNVDKPLVVRRHEHDGDL